MMKSHKSAIKFALATLCLCTTFIAGAAAEPWARQCNGPAGTPDEKCSIRQIVNVGQQVAMTVSFALVGPQNQPRGVYMVPLNAVLANGLTIRVDENQQSVLPFDFCTRQGCRASIQLSSSLLQSMKSGRFLHAAWMDVGGKPAQFRFDLAGFTAAWSILEN